MPINLSYVDTSSPNPSLWLDQNTLGADPATYAVAPIDPAYASEQGDWFKVNEFCSVLAVDWLVGNRPGAWGASNYSAAQLKDAAQQLITFESLDDQLLYAAQRLGGTQAESVEAVAGRVESGLAPVGTMIWAGSSDHVVAAYVDSGTSLLFYDPNNGKSERIDRADFAAKMAKFAVNLIVMR